MNRLIKGSIAGAAGIALLLGGAGTLALWNANATVGAGSISAGQLDIAAQAGTGAWMDGSTPIADISSYRIVPGDSITYTASFDVTATGDNLSATVALGAGSIAPAVSTDAEDLALAALLTSSTAFEVGDVATTTVLASTGTQVVDVTVTITFPDGAHATVDDNDGMNGTVDLSNFTVTLTQNL